MARRRRGWRIALGVLAAVCALMLLAVVLVANLDWNRAKPWINAQVSEATGRHFAIEGDLSADWHWPQPLETGWRRWVPGVTVHAGQLVMGNPQGFAVQEEPLPNGVASDGLPALPPKPAPQAEKTGGKTAEKDAAASEAAAQAQAQAQAQTPPRSPETMATIAQASATLRLLPLLARTVVLDTVELTAPDVALGRRRDGVNNWSFQMPASEGEGEKSSPWRVQLDRLVVHGGWLAYADGVKDLALRARLDTVEPAADAKPSPYGLRFVLAGRYGKARISGDGQAGPVLSLREQAVNYPLQFKARAGSLGVEAEGTLANPAALAGMDLQVMLQGASMADLYELTGLVLPNTPPFRTTGHLVGSLTPQRAVWNYRDFQGVVGQSDVSGTLTYTSGQPRPKLSGAITSRQLRLADLGPVVGAPSGENHKDKGTSVPKGKVLPDAQFATDRWNAMDVDVKVTGQRIVRPEALPIDNLQLHARLNDAELSLSPLRFGVAQGVFDAQVVLDGRRQPMQGQLRGTVEGLRLSALFPKVALMDKSLGRLDGAVAVNASGNSVAHLLGTSTGEARIYIRDGTFSKQLLDLAALNVGSVVVGKLFGSDKEVRLRCAVADFALKNGKAETRNVKLSTDEAIVQAVGTVDLAKEYMDLRILPESLQWKFFSLRTPLYVRGSFAQPKVGLEAGPLILRAGAAVAAAVAAPAALALVPITVPAAQDDANCAQLLAQANRTVRGGAAGAAPKPEAAGSKPPATVRPKVEAPKHRAPQQAQ